MPRRWFGLPWWWWWFGAALLVGYDDLVRAFVAVGFSDRDARLAAVGLVLLVAAGITITASVAILKNGARLVALVRRRLRWLGRLRLSRGRWAVVDVTLVPSTGAGSDNVPDARITVQTGSVGGRFTVRGRIVGYVNDGNFVPTADYTLPWADAIGEFMDIRPHDARAVRVGKAFYDHAVGLSTFDLLAATTTYMGGGAKSHHQVRWDPHEVTTMTLPRYQLEIRVYLDGSSRRPKKEIFFSGPATQRGPANVTREERLADLGEIRRGLGQ